MLIDGEEHNDLCVGIDLGTSNSVLATVNLKANGDIVSRVVNLPCAVDMYAGSIFSMKNLPTLPSCVYYNEAKNFAPIIGDFAKNRYSLRPHLVAKSIKSQMENETFEGLSPDVPDKTPAEISARILSHMLNGAAKIYRLPKIDDAVITVPEGFNSVMRQATLKAAEIAGIKIKNSDGTPRSVLLPEPQAVIYDYINLIRNGEFSAQILNLSAEKNVLVFDLSGGTLDVTLYKISKRQDAPELLNVENLATSRYTLLGGDDFDLALANEMFLRYMKKYISYPYVVQKIKREEKSIIAQLLNYAEDLKIRVGTDKSSAFGGMPDEWGDEGTDKYNVGGNISATGYAYDDNFTTQELENVWQKFMGEDFSFDDYKNFDEISKRHDTANIIFPVLDVLKKCADKSGSEDFKVDAVLMSGGMSNFYMVVNRLEKFFGFAPVVMPEPELSVARGAAVYHYFLHKYGENLTQKHIGENQITADIDTKTSTFRFDDDKNFSEISTETIPFSIDADKISSDNVLAETRDFHFMQLMNELLKIYSRKNDTLMASVKIIAEEMYKLGNIYHNGLGGVAQDFSAAVRWYERAGSLGHEKSAYDIALIYYKGNGVTQDVDKARRLFKKAAKFENASAMYYLGLIYKNGEGVKQNLEKAFEWFEKSADKNNEDAIHELGMMYYNGEGVEQDFDKAAYWLSKSKKFVDSEVAFHLGKIYDEEYNFPSKAREWYEKAANAGHADAMYKIAVIYQEFKNSQLAAEWYGKAAELGHVESMFEIGRMFYEGEGLNINHDMAFKWFQKSAELGNPKAMCNLGSMYIEKNDFEKAVELFEKAIENGDDEINDKPIDNLAQMYLFGMGVEKNYEKARELFEEAADLGNADAKEKLGTMYYEGLGVKKDFEKAAEFGNKDAMYKLGEMYCYGSGVEKNIDKATYWLKKSGKLINGNLAYNIGEFYYDKKNLREAVKWYEQADKNADALYKLGLIYYNDNNAFGVYQNLRRAAEYFERAADLGKVDAMKILFDIYNKGVGVARNFSKAVYWLEKAAKYGNAEIMYRLAEIYYSGRGGTKFGSSSDVLPKSR